MSNNLQPLMDIGIAGIFFSDKIVSATFWVVAFSSSWTHRGIL